MDDCYECLQLDAMSNLVTIPVSSALIAQAAAVYIQKHKTMRGAKFTRPITHDQALAKQPSRLVSKFEALESR
jgi:hypothetical protein